MTRPASYNTTWANAGQQIAGEGDAKTQEFMKTGWEGGSDKKPPHAPTQNYHMQKTDLTLQEIERQGLLSWRNDVPYQKGARVFWHGSTFQALKDTTGTEPQGSGDNGTWYLVPIQSYPSSYENVHGLGTAAKHNEGDFERTGVAADLDGKLWKLITANYVAKAGGTYDGVINGQAPARGDRGSAIPTAQWCGQEFDVKGAADAVQRNLDKVNDEAWKGINDAWAKANDAQGRVSFYEWLMGGSGDRNFWYIGDRLGVNSLLQQEAGYLTAKYGGKTTFRVTPGGLIDFGSIDWTHVENKYVVGEGDETGIVRMNGAKNIWDVNAKNYAASQCQARQAHEAGVKAQQGVDSLKDIISKPYNDYLYLGGASDKVGGAIIKNEAGWLSSMLNNIATFQVNPDGLITKGSIDVSKVVNDYDSGPGYIKNKKTGLIIQFGFASNSNKNEVIQKFPLYFSSRNYVVVASDLGPGGGGNIWADWKETGQCRLGENNSPNIYVQYIAIGY